MSNHPASRVSHQMSKAGSLHFLATHVETRRYIYDRLVPPARLLLIFALACYFGITMEIRLWEFLAHNGFLGAEVTTNGQFHQAQVTPTPPPPPAPYYAFRYGFLRLTLQLLFSFVWFLGFKALLETVPKRIYGTPAEDAILAIACLAIPIIFISGMLFGTFFVSGFVIAQWVTLYGLYISLWSLKSSTILRRSIMAFFACAFIISFIL